VLGDFRAWLEQLGARAAFGIEAPPAGDAPEPPDLHALIAQMTALRHEVNLQTKAMRAQQEQNAQALQQLAQAVEHVQESPSSRASSEGGDDEAIRPFLKTLLDITDALMLARRELARGRQAIGTALQQAAVRASRQRSPLERWFSPRVRQQIEWLLRRLLGETAPPDPAARAEQLLDALITGYNMSIQRAERALQQYGLERIACAGQPFDPERMEVIEVVKDTPHPPGRVVEEVRPGYLRHRRVFRCAQVSVAK
jgi:molecular chaperone GrpE